MLVNNITLRTYGAQVLLAQIVDAVDVSARLQGLHQCIYLAQIVDAAIDCVLLTL